VTTDILYTFKVKWLKVKVTTRRNGSAVKRYKSATDRLTDFELGENYERTLALERFFSLHTFVRRLKTY